MFDSRNRTPRQGGYRQNENSREQRGASMSADGTSSFRPRFNPSNATPQESGRRRQRITRTAGAVRVEPNEGRSSFRPKFNQGGEQQGERSFRPRPKHNASVYLYSFGKQKHCFFVWFYDMKADGFSLDDKRTPVSENDIPDIIERFHNLDKEADRAKTEQSFFVDKQDIVNNDYDLSINKYKETEYVPVEYPSTVEIMADLHELEMEITKGLAELEEML